MFLRRAVQRYYKRQGFQANFPRGGIHCGNCFIDGEVQLGALKIAVELKSDNDDLLRGLGQLLEALSHGYNQALLCTSQSRAERLDVKVFEVTSIGLVAINSKGQVHFIKEPKIVKFLKEE